ncbi:C40 family peptidase [Saccharibacillus qingshengii]|uniref:C40 family peptidase n=1 Tax=Saccharibacillus qingshengii TaxID=1763540 RepID=UPI0015551638|nr:C40 family peptidase [Saccharibacillus qingshengii]
MKKISLVLAGAILLSSFSASSVSASESLSESVNEYIGVPYKWGGTTKSGMDCSGFILAVIDHFNINLPRVSRDQAKAGTPVSRENLRPGDLVFFNTFGKGISHAGIYVGNGEFAHSSSSKGVRISPMNQGYFKNKYVTARRVTSTSTYQHMTQS